MKKPKAFTLVELLVVIAIIALLLAILVPSLRKAKESAASAVCRSNLKQLATALTLYEQHYDNEPILLDAATTTVKYWFAKIAPFMGDARYEEDQAKNLEGAMKVMYCPSAPKVLSKFTDSVPGTAKSAWRHHLGTGAEGSYGLNSWVSWDVFYSGTCRKGRHYPDFSDVGSKVPVFSDAVWANGWPREDDLGPEDLDKGDALDWDNQMSRVCIDRHNMAVNVAFGDLHVETVKLVKLWTLKWHQGFTVDNTVKQVPREPPRRR